MLAIICPGQGTQTPGMLAPWLELEGARELLTEWSERAGLDLISLGTTADAETIAQTQDAQPLIVATSLLAATALSSVPFLDFPTPRNWQYQFREDPGSAIPVPGPQNDGEREHEPQNDQSVKLVETTGSPTIVVAGHSLGAITAAAVAGVFGYADAVAIAAKRGEFMAEMPRHDHHGEGGMLAVIGSTLDEVHEAAIAAGLQVATVNAQNQVVVAGPLDKLNDFKPPGRARTIRLMVSGPFHTAAYHGAAEKFAAALAAYDIHDPVIPIVNDLDGGIITALRDPATKFMRSAVNPPKREVAVPNGSAQDDGEGTPVAAPPPHEFASQIRRHPATAAPPAQDDVRGAMRATEVVNYLIKQVTSPVRWDLVTSQLAEATCIIELAPAGTLTKLARRALTAEIISINTPADIAAGRNLLADNLP